MKKILAIVLNLWLFATVGHSEPLNVGTASWYGSECDGKIMANGKPFNPQAFTCASWFYSLGTKLSVTNISNGKSTIVFVTDRGPAKALVRKGRILDLSHASFAAIGNTWQGIIAVSITKI